MKNLSNAVLIQTRGESYKRIYGEDPEEALLKALIMQEGL